LLKCSGYGGQGVGRKREQGVCGGSESSLRSMWVKQEQL